MLKTVNDVENMRETKYIRVLNGKIIFHCDIYNEFVIHLLIIVIVTTI